MCIFMCVCHVGLCGGLVCCTFKNTWHIQTADHRTAQGATGVGTHQSDANRTKIMTRPSSSSTCFCTCGDFNCSSQLSSACCACKPLLAINHVTYCLRFIQRALPRRSIAAPRGPRQGTRQGNRSTDTGQSTRMHIQITLNARLACETNEARMRTCTHMNNSHEAM